MPQPVTVSVGVVRPRQGVFDHVDVAAPGARGERRTRDMKRLAAPPEKD